MIYLGTCAFGDNECYYIPSTAINNINSIVLKNAIFDELMATKDMEYELIDDYPSIWNQALIFHGTYNNGTLTIGNIDFIVSNTTDILIKKREKGSFNWQTIYHKDINSIEDFNFTFLDYYSKAKTNYEYGISNICDGVEGDISLVECHSDFGGYYIVKNDQLFNLILDLKLDRQRNAPRAFITGLNKRYPDTILTSKANYYSGSATATVIEYNLERCDLNMDDAWKYRDKFIDFLMDGTPKIMKTHDGKCYIINIDNTPSESYSGFWNLPSTSFSFVQVGSIESNKDLYMNGLIDLDEKWWSL